MAKKKTSAEGKGISIKKAIFRAYKESLKNVKTKSISKLKNI